MSLTSEFIESTLQATTPFLRKRGSAPLSAARSLVGKAARVAQVVPDAMPFSAALRAALTDSLRVLREEYVETQSNVVPVARFFTAAGWFNALLRERDHVSLFPLERRVMAQEVPLILQESSFRIQFDGSPWGGGALLLQGSQPIEYFSVVWDEGILRRIGATQGDSRWQSVWEFVTLLLSLLLWGHLSAESLLCILGDNIAALQLALTLKGRGHMLTISREISWRKIRFNWHFGVQHLPKDQNTVADALSRMYAPSPAKLPVVLQSPLIKRRSTPLWPDVWQAWVEAPA